MKTLVCAAFLGLSLAGSASADDLQTVPYVEVSQYLGTWYEIARLPQIFELGCTGVTAAYSLNADGSVKVVNTCRFLKTDGIPITITGNAVPIDDTNSKLDVTFFNGLSKGKYWILELDADYKWALVGDPDRSSLFFLSRQPTLDDAVYQDLLNAAVEKHGYDVSRVVKTKQM